MIAYIEYGYDNILSYDMISYVIYACMISYIHEIIHDGCVISYAYNFNNMILYIIKS